MKILNPNKIITVCENCLCACCAQGKHQCKKPDSGTTKKTVFELRQLEIENEFFWHGEMG